MSILTGTIRGSQDGERKVKIGLLVGSGRRTAERWKSGKVERAQASESKAIIRQGASEQSPFTSPLLPLLLVASVPGKVNNKIAKTAAAIQAQCSQERGRLVCHCYCTWSSNSSRMLQRNSYPGTTHHDFPLHPY